MDLETKTYPVLAALRHNGTRHEPGDSVEMTEAQAETLQALGILGEVNASESTAVEHSAEDRKAAIIEAISRLVPDTDFNKDGTPKVKTVELLTRFDVSADEVKALHAELKAEADTKTGEQA
ncbi:hypothetical protein [Pseudovibrio sp. Tun.PSC04-5.I4]|uniref:DUF7210 family protein n=1 Tax=Pseudovibrio sp. Tun.PSC04-5.I4 TaxID=1798213 RepID=UPI000890CC37|nr:hypothetical protein [Pseudovibrio sp. Tun.PSC04-5.I4]SDQ17455.1 hypothetical protein SAMN04515695_0323 [Pseudovibrio sp. Tun.PSC04-5.I4]